MNVYLNVQNTGLCITVNVLRPLSQERTKRRQFLRLQFEHFTQFMSLEIRYQPDMRQPENVNHLLLMCFH